jgi:hypothetical protein
MSDLFVLVNLLSSDERVLRRDGGFTHETLDILFNYDFTGQYAISLADCQALSDRLHVGMSIITFNAERIRSYCYYFHQLYEQFRNHLFSTPDVVLEQPSLNSSQMALALEFFLQVDGIVACMLYNFVLIDVLSLI